MGLRATRFLRRAGWFALAALAVLAGVDAVVLERATTLNARIDRIVQDTASSGGAPGAEGLDGIDTGDAPAELRFAQAYALAAAGRLDAALTRYGALQADTPLGQAARYNSANLLLRQGADLQAGAHPGQALAHIELAKETYREVLRNDGADWLARYNLERAQRLVPDPDDAEELAPDVNRRAERAATTMRGYSPGLP
jgi:mxaK protein